MPVCVTVPKLFRAASMSKKTLAVPIVELPSRLVTPVPLMVPADHVVAPVTVMLASPVSVSPLRVSEVKVTEQVPLTVPATVTVALPLGLTGPGKREAAGNGHVIARSVIDNQAAGTGELGTGSEVVGSVVQLEEGAGCRRIAPRVRAAPLKNQPIHLHADGATVVKGAADEGVDRPGLDESTGVSERCLRWKKPRRESRPAVARPRSHRPGDW